jgi:putative Holliday junction resolvase
MNGMAPFPSASPALHSGRQGGVILAIDYGRRRIGLALSDALGMTARPLETWTRSNRRRDLSRLRDLCVRHGVTRIVVGWPLHLDGTQSEMAQEAARFAERLRNNLNLPVELVDERLSSWEAQQTLTQTSGRARGATRRRRNALDEVAAAVILRDYLGRTSGAAQG